MTGLPTLDPEIAGLGLAIGLLTPTGGGVELDSDWFDDPGTRMAGVLADDDRREALVRFADAVLAQGAQAQQDGVDLIPLFNLRNLAGDNSLPDLTVQVSLDARANKYVEVGLAATLSTTGPATRTEVRVPLYRAAKHGQSVTQPFALLAGGAVRIATELTLQTGPVPPGGFGLAGVAASVETPLSGAGQPAFTLRLKGLHLPGAAAAQDFQVGGPGSSIEDALLSLVLGLVRQGAAGLSGAAAAQLGAALNLLGLGQAAGIPPLPVDQVLARGPGALRDWIVDLVRSPAARQAWLQALAAMLGGTAAGDHIDVPIGAGPVAARIGWAAATAPSGHLQVTPQLALSMHADVAGGLRVGAQASADLVTIDVATGSILAVPSAEIVVTAASTDPAANLLQAGNVAGVGTFAVKGLRLGLALQKGQPRVIAALQTVTLDGDAVGDLDLTNPDAVKEAAGHAAADLLGQALDALGTAADDLKALLGLAPPPGVPALDGLNLLTDPLGTVRAWWHTLVTAHAGDVPTVLAHLQDLISAAPQLAQPVTGTGTAADPWSIPIVNRLDLDSWVDGDRLVIAAGVSLRVDDLAGGCTVVQTALRVQLVALDLVGAHAQFLAGVDLTARARARGGTQARLALGQIAIIADSIGVAAGWSATGGLWAGLAAPNLALDTGIALVPLVLPTVDANGHVNVPPAAWGSVEMLIGVLAASGPPGWLSDLVDLTGWSLTPRPNSPHLSLAKLVVDPVAALTDWAGELVTDGDLVGSMAATLAHLLTGSQAGRSGVFVGSGTTEDPWLVGLGQSADLPAIAVWLGPHGPSVAASTASHALQSWRPGMPGLGAAGLAQCLFDEALADPDVALLAAGRDGIADGLQALADRWVGTDGLVGPPPAPIAGLTTVLRPDLDAGALPDLPIEGLIPGGLPANAVVVRVAVGDPPWTPAGGRLIDLTAPGLAPASFTVADPATGEWVVALAPRAQAGLGASDPSGVLGQAARLQQVLTPLASAGPVALIAFGGAGHAARVAAGAVVGVTNLITLGTPWSDITFDTARTGVPADALRLMRALLPAPDPMEPDDADLALGRALIGGFMNAVRGTPAITDLEAPRPDLPVRAGLSAVAVFGVLAVPPVARAITAVVAAGLAARAQARAADAAMPPDTTYLGVQVPVPPVTPAGGHGVTVSAAVTLVLASVTSSLQATTTPTVRLDLAVADTDGWLVGGPGTVPVGGTLPLELRRLRARVDFGLRGGPSSTEIVLGEGAALGADWVSMQVRPPTQATGGLELQPLLPEAQALVAALAGKLAVAPAGSPAAVLLDLLRATGVCNAVGELVPDALAALLHDTGTQLRGRIAPAATRAALLDALGRLIPGVTVTGDQVHLALDPLTADADTVTGVISVSATETGLLAWQFGAGLPATGPPTMSFRLGDPAVDAAALSIQSGPQRVQLIRDAGAPVQIWPATDVDGLSRLAAVAVPAEALRVVLEGLRRIDNQLGTALEDLMSALGLLGPPDAAAHRAVKAPVLLFENPGAWFARAGVLGVAGGGPLNVEKVIDLLEAIKPFVRLAGTPRGVWPITGGVQISVAAAAAGPAMTLDVDATSWLAGAVGRAPFAGGFSAGLTLPTTGAPRPTVEIFIGEPDGPGGTTTPQHRRAAHVKVDAAGLRVFLRPAAGADIELYPNLAGLGDLLAQNVTKLLAPALTAVAAMSGDPVRTDLAGLVGATGRGLSVAAGSPAVFDAAALKTLAADPVGYLQAHIGALLTQAGPALDAVLLRLLGLPAGSHAAVLSGAGVLTVAVRTLAVEVHPAPFSVHVTASATGLPVVGAASLSLTADHTGLTGWAATAGPASLNLSGPVIRPFVRGGSDQPAGWRCELGLALDPSAATAIGHRELLARWRQAQGMIVLATVKTAGGTDEDSTPAGVAVAAIDAVLDLAGAWVLGVAEVKALLARPVGSQTVRKVLEGSILDPAAPAGAPELLSNTLTGWPGKLLTLADQLATAAPGVTVGPFHIGIADTAGVLGVSLTTANQAGIDLSSGGELALHLEADASWIEPPAGPAPPPGIVLNVLKHSGASIVAAPGIAVNGVGLRLGKTSGPLIDAGLRLQSVAVHLFGSVQLDAAQHPQFAGGIQVELAGLAVPLGVGGGDNAVARGIVSDAGGSGSPPRPAFSPALAVQDHGHGVAITLRAGSGDGPWFLPIQRAFGPVYLEQVGLGVAYKQGLTPRQLEMISLYLDGSVSLLGLSASVDKLRLGYHVSRPFFAGSSWEVDVEGFAIASTIGGLTLAGALHKFPLDAPLTGVEYLGMLKIRYAVYGLDLFGGYAHPTTPGGASYASFFAFGVLHAPIGGVPAFFITGIGAGLGINRELHAPRIDEVNTHPFMLALRASGPTPDPMHQLQDMRALSPPAQGQFWVAAGISFTSFVLITGEILVTVQFGDGLEIAVLGLARAALPTSALTLVSIELALLARFSEKEGLLLVQAQLTANSWLLSKSVRLTGGFAFETWWKGSNAGQFVITVGGYHPRFHHDGYPVVPRVGLNWSPIHNISVVGGVYFALCSEALMAGAAIEVAAHFGPAHARLAFGGDAIVFFDPFWFLVSAYAEVDVGITIWLLFGTVDLELSLGVSIEVSGPPIFVHGQFSVCGFEVPFEFGDQGDPTDRALHAGDFAKKYLRGDKDAQVTQATVIRGSQVAGKSSGSGGQDKPPDGSKEHPFRVAPEFQATFVTTVPTEHLTLAGPGGPKNTTVAAPGLGVAPMYSATLDSTLTLTIASEDQPPQTFSVTGVGLSPRPAAGYPKGVWGPAPNPKAPTVPAGDTVDACDGMTLDAVLPDSLFTGAAPIDYHQVELPLAGRKPLPFVTNRTQTDQRVTQAVALQNAAAVLTAGNPTTAQRFERAARVLAAGGSGRGTVAALRGDRAATPGFGSLADDLVVSPDAVSPTVTAVVVDRAKPPGPRHAPIVKSVLGLPLSLTGDGLGHTTVADPGIAVPGIVPTLTGTRTAYAGVTQAALVLRTRPAGAGREASRTTINAVGRVPVTRLATSSVAAVANARPAPPAAKRLAAMSDRLLDSKTGPGAGGTVIADGELAVITVANRPAGAKLDTLLVSGGPTRVLCLAAGGRALDDRVVADTGGGISAVELQRATERVAVLGVGSSPTVGGPIAGWYAGQSLPSVGWGAALAGGAVVTAQATRIPDHRERADGGWVPTKLLSTAAQVVTVFTDPVDAIAIVIDDYAGGDAAGKVSMRLLDAVRASADDGSSRPPQVLVDGVRSILLYAASTTGPEPGVLVDGCGGGHLAGVLGAAGGVAALAATLARTGVEAAVRQPLVGGPGRRWVTFALGDGPVARQVGAAPRKERR